MKLIPDDKFEITEKTFVIALIVFSVLGSAGALLLRQFNLFLLGIYLSIPMLLSVAIWKVIKNNDTRALQIKGCLNLLAAFAFLICFLFSILSLYLFPVRTIGYYVLLAAMGSLILAQILCAGEITPKQSKIILLQIISLFLNIIWGVTLKYYFFVGRTDALFHSWVIENLLTNGHINQTFDIYDAFPLWHILCSFIYQLIGLSEIPARVTYIANGIIFACLVLIIYLVTAKIFNLKVALLSSLFLCFNTDAVFYGMYSIPRSVIFFLEGLLIYLLLQKKTLLYMAFCILTIIGLIMYHTASMPFILCILVLLYVLQTVYRVAPGERVINFNFILLIFILTVTYWMYAGVKVFDSVSGSLLGKASVGTLTKSIVNTPLSELFNYLQYSPLLLFVILGVLLGLRASELKAGTKIFLITALLLVPVTFPGPALLLNKLAGNFNLSRFGEYSFIFICIAGAAGLYLLFSKLKTKYKYPVFILFFIMAFLSVSNDFTASDNPLVKRPFYTFYLSEEECISLKRAAELTDTYLMSDYITCSYLENSEYSKKINVLEVDKTSQKFLKKSKNDIIAVRETELSRRPLKLYTSPNGEFILNPSLEVTMDYYYSNAPLWSTLDDYNTIYDSGAVRLYQ